MIRLTSLQGRPVEVALRDIFGVEIGANTRIHLTSDHHMLVKETPEEVVERIVAYQRRLFWGLPPHTGRP